MVSRAIKALHAAIVPRISRFYNGRHLIRLNGLLTLSSPGAGTLRESSGGLCLAMASTYT